MSSNLAKQSVCASSQYASTNRCNGVPCLDHSQCKNECNDGFCTDSHGPLLSPFYYYAATITCLILFFTAMACIIYRAKVRNRRLQLQIQRQNQLISQVILNENQQ